MAQGYYRTRRMLDDEVVNRSAYQLVDTAFIGDAHHDHVAAEIAGRFADLRTGIADAENAFDRDVVGSQLVELAAQFLVQRRMLVNSPRRIRHVADVHDDQLGLA